MPSQVNWRTGFWGTIPEAWDSPSKRSTELVSSFREPIDDRDRLCVDEAQFTKAGEESRIQSIRRRAGVKVFPWITRRAAQLATCAAPLPACDGRRARNDLAIGRTLAPPP